MHPNAKMLEDFYTGFAALEAEPMVSAYADDARFSDPVFPDLDAREVRGMWRMLTERAQEFELTFSGVEADDGFGKAHWEAKYLFSATGRRVHNVIDAEFRFRDSQIVHHVDRFDFWRWSRMALGLPGVLLGWSPFIRSKVRGTARRSLDKFLGGS